MTLALRGKSRRRKALLILSAVIAVVVAAFGGTALRGNWSAAAADPLPSSIQLYQWETGGGSWVTGNLGAHNSSYAEGETVPFRLDVSGVPLGQYTFPVCRDYSNGTEFGYNFHTPFETTETTTHGAITSTLGNFSAEGATVDIVAGGNTQGVCNADHRETTVTITITAATAFVYFGGHLAAPTDPGVGFGNGASQYPGSSLHMDIEGKDRSINPASIGVLWIVNKDFTDNNSANVTVSLQCTGTGTSVIVLDNTASEADPADFNVFGATSTVTCTATEVVPAGYTADESDCLAVPVGDGTCTIVNTPSTRQITVKKVRAGLASGDVTFAGTISNGPDSAFSILTNANGQFGQDRTVDLQSHTVVETPVPAGWTLAGYKTLSGLNADCVADTSGYTSSGNVIPASSASYTVCVKNTYNTGTFEVVKDFVPNAGGTVTVGLVCASGSVVNDDTSASEADPANFTVNGYSGDPLCTATESAVPAGYSSTGTCSALLSVGTCTITNTLNTDTFEVVKDFSDNSTASVTVGLVCASGSVVNDDVTASEADPANFTVNGYSGDPLCTATESAVPAGYTSTGTCSALLSVGTCTIVNTLRTDGFVVLKDFVPDAGGSVTVGLVCGSGSVVNDDVTASEADPANFTVNGYSGDPLCTATESAVPAGYSSTGTCSALLSVGTCTIVNTLNTDTFEVVKDFSDNNTASVTVSLVCGSGSVVNDDVTASEADPANFTVNGYSGDPLCTATESAVPAGYSSTGTCSALLSVGTCTIVNTLNTDTFEVVKDFSDNNTASVTVGLVCGSGSVVNDDVTASEADPANFTVNGYSGDPLCTATESAVPAGYTSTGTCSALLSVGTCTIVNTLNTDTFEVVKDFSDNNTASVTVGLVCGSGSVVNDDTSASEADPANFTVNGYSGDPLCTATESAVPAGYSSTGTCSALLSVGTCTIVNTLNTAQFVVVKDFVPNASGEVTVGLVCTSGSVVNDDVTASEADPANFTVNGFVGDASGVNCVATETAIPAGYDSSGTCEASLATGTCTITNTLRTADFTVLKNFIPNAAGSVTVNLSCTSGNVVVVDATASEADPADFDVNSYSGNPLCTATETTVPAGYSSSGTCQALLSVGACTITNTRLGSLLVRKQTFQGAIPHPEENGGWTIHVTSANCGVNLTGVTAQGNPYGTVAFNGLPFCSDYVVSEDANSKGSAWSTTQSSFSGVTVPLNTTVTIDFVNRLAVPETPTPTPTATPTATPVPQTQPAQPTATSTPIEEVAGEKTQAPTPVPPSAGTGVQGGDGGALNLAFALGGLLAIGGGLLMLRLSRRRED